MVKSRRDLHQSLQETLFWLLQREPNTLPMLMSFKELLAAVAVQSVSEVAGGPVEICAHSETSEAAD